MTRILTAEEVSEWLKLNINTVYRLANRGQLPGRKIGDKWFFPEEEIEAMVRTKKEPVAAG